MKQQDYSSYVLPIGALVIAYIVLKRFGIIKDTAKETQQTGQILTPYFNENYWQQLGKSRPGAKVMLLTVGGLDAITRAIRKGIGTFYDDESAILAAFKRMKYKSQISQVAGHYRKLYNKDLASHLVENLNAQELNLIYNYTDNLPTGLL
jgi:hypothetical protein